VSGRESEIERERGAGAAAEVVERRWRCGGGVVVEW